MIEYYKTLDMLMYKDARHLFQVRLLAHANQATRHNLADPLALFGNDVILCNNTYNDIIISNDRHATDAMSGKETRYLLFCLIFFDSNNLRCHYVLDFHFVLPS